MHDDLEHLLEGISTIVENREVDDDNLNNIMAAGAVFAALLQADRILDPTPVGYPHPGATNVVEFGLEFMTSRYRATITRVTD